MQTDSSQHLETAPLTLREPLPLQPARIMAEAPATALLALPEATT